MLSFTLPETRVNDFPKKMAIVQFFTKLHRQYKKLDEEIEFENIKMYPLREKLRIVVN